MINKEYRKAALRTYGESCELCGHRTSLEVHHIDYQEHQKMENELRTMVKLNADNRDYLNQLEEAKKQGYDYFDKKISQLSKNDDTVNTSVLCGNCHSLCHLIDYGKNILKALKPRIKGGR